MAMVVGTCSLCEGPVEVPEAWMSVNRPVPRCRSCGATAKRPHGPVIEMVPGPTTIRIPIRGMREPEVMS